MRSVLHKLPLGEFVDFQNGFAFKSGEYTKEGHYLMRIKNVQQGYIEINDQCFVKIPNEEKYEKFILKNGDILVSLTGNVGRVAIIEEEHLPAALNQRVARVTPRNKQILDSKYLYYLLRTPEFLDFAIGAGKGAAQQNISTNDMEKFKVQVPTLAKQRKIVEKLDQAFTEIDLLIEQNEFKSNLLKQIFDQEIESIFHRNIHKWPETTIGQTCDYKNGKAHEQLVDLNGKFRLVTSKFVSSDGMSARRVIESLTPLISGDIAFVLSDLPNGKALAKAFLVTNEKDLTLNQRVLRVRSKNFDPNFLYYSINRNPYLRSFDNGESQTHLKLAQVLACPLLMPDLKTQIEVATRISKLRQEVEKAVHILSQESILIEALKVSILHESFTQIEQMDEVAS